MGLSTNLTEAILHAWWDQAPDAILQHTPALHAALLAQIAAEAIIPLLELDTASEGHKEALDDLWACIGANEIEHLQESTRKLARLNHELLWHTPHDHDHQAPVS